MMGNMRTYKSETKKTTTECSFATKKQYNEKKNKQVCMSDFHKIYQIESVKIQWQ